MLWGTSPPKLLSEWNIFPGKAEPGGTISSPFVLLDRDGVSELMRYVTSTQSIIKA